jgi:hypothetical protein
MKLRSDVNVMCSGATMDHTRTKPDELGSAGLVLRMTRMTNDQKPRMTRMTRTTSVQQVCTSP